jgi:hypothetical protein
MTVRGAARSVFERFTDGSRRVVVLAQEEARMLNHNYIGTEHILLGLLREGGGVAAQVMVRLDADLNRSRQQVIQLLHGYQGQDAGSADSHLGERVRAGLPDDVLARFDALDRRLTALERWVRRSLWCDHCTAPARAACLRPGHPQARLAAMTSGIDNNPEDEYADDEYADHDAEDREQPSTPADIPDDEPEEDVLEQRQEVPYREDDR